MKKTTDSNAWYGELRTKRGNTLVIRDDELPAPPVAGRVYLFNTEREAMVQYDEAIVSDKLFELDDEQKQQAQAKFNSAWEAAKKQLTKGFGKAPATTETKTSSATDLLPEDDDDDGDFDDDD